MSALTTPPETSSDGSVPDGQQHNAAPTNSQVHRILLVDDNRAIHEDYRKILAEPDDPIAVLEAEIFGETKAPERNTVVFDLVSAYQGQEALALLEQATEAAQPFAVAFVDVRMPPGWDGVETVERLWKVDPDLQVVLCTAYTDYSWRQIVDRLAHKDGFLILRKPFDSIEVAQMAQSLSQKWALQRAAQQRLSDLDGEVQARNHMLAEANAKLKQEMEEREKMELELRLAQKLEAVGQLAAGVAHEVNTPIQFVGDSVHFLEGAFEDLVGLVGHYNGFCTSLGEDEKHKQALQEIAEQEEMADLEYLMEHVPKAFERTSAGIARVTKIVRAMKEFAHPDQTQMEDADINQAIDTTLTVARNEYKYVADVEANLGELPMVKCYLGELSQVFLNLVVNAAHAIEDVVKDSGNRGTITIATESVPDSEHVRVSISDTGCGIPDSIRNRIFDPFFTTKEVGKGTGQGLAITRTIITEKHQGTLEVESEEGKGTTFILTLPVRPPEPKSKQQPASAEATQVQS